MKVTNDSLHYVKWPLPNVVAFTTTRHSPFLEQPVYHTHKNQPYNSFNLGDHVGDIDENVLANRLELKKLLLPQESPNELINVQWLTQVHEANVVEVKEHSAQPYISDAAITRTPYIALSVMTADCLPILLSANDGNEIAAIHGGWKPLAKSIVSNTVLKMKTAPKHISAWLGPCISQHSFEVGAEVKSAFVSQGAEFEQAFTQGDKPQHYLANLHEIATIQLNRLGVFDISSLPHCTYEKSDDYYSYRRDGVTGRMASIIMIANK